MIRDGITGQKRMASLYGAPAEGMLWCSGFEITPHQVPAEEIVPKTCRCRDCRHRFDAQYRNLAPRRAEVRENRRGPSESDVRYVEPGRLPPGNHGHIPLPTWGYVPPERKHRALRYSEKAVA